MTTRDGPPRGGWAVWLVVTATLLGCAVAQAAVGVREIPGRPGDEPVTLFYPTAAPEHPVQRRLPGGELTLQLAEQAEPQAGNGWLVVISHGSGGMPWVHVDLARALVQAGYVVAFPLHRADHWKDGSDPGPGSFARRPVEVSHAIDAVAADARFAPLLALDKVGMYGMSAGGHTALELAGGRWSDANFKRHCEAHLAEDFQSCVGLITQLTGGPLDGVKQWLALAVIRHRFGGEAVHAHTDPRIAAIVAGVPSSADFDMSSLAAPTVPVGLVTAPLDRWLVPRFHSDEVLRACRRCTLIAEVPGAGHGALLSPLPPGLYGLLGELLNDPPGFDRGQMPAVDQRIVAFFGRYLLPR